MAVLLVPDLARPGGTTTSRRGTGLDLTAAAGVGVVGRGAAGVIRAVLPSVLAANIDLPAADRVQVVVTEDDLAMLFGRDRQFEVLPTGLRVMATPQDALNLVEAEILTRINNTGRFADPTGAPAPTRTVTGPADIATDIATAAPGSMRAGSPLMLLLGTIVRGLAGWQTALDNGAACGLSGLLMEQWRAGVTVHVFADGLVWAADHGPAEALRGSHLFRGGADATLDLLTLFGQLRL
jgi:hypothetical protein